MTLFTRLLLILLATPTMAQAAPANWVLSDLSQVPELKAFFGNADALITVQDTAEPDLKAIRPTIFVYKLQQKPSQRLRSAKEWYRYISHSIKKGRRVVLKQDATEAGRYILEFTARSDDSSTDLQAVYLAIQDDDGSVSLFVHDSVGTASSKNLPLVRELYSRMNRKLLMDMYNANVPQQKPES